MHVEQQRLGAWMAEFDTLLVNGRGEQGHASDGNQSGDAHGKKFYRIARFRECGRAWLAWTS
jgi:hypothetical protein